MDAYNKNSYSDNTVTKVKLENIENGIEAVTNTVIELEQTGNTPAPGSVTEEMLDAELKGRIEEAANKKCPTLTEDQKRSIKNLCYNYWYYASQQNLFVYKAAKYRDALTSADTAFDGGKAVINCSLFLQNIMMGRKVSDYAKKSTYTPAIKKAFDFGHYAKFKSYQMCYGLHKDGDTPETYYYNFRRGVSSDSLENSFSDNSYWSPQAESEGRLGGQYFNPYMAANDIARELYEMGCEIPLSELDVGDIIFIKNIAPMDGSTTNFYHDRICWRQIAHAAIVSDVTSDGNFLFTHSSASTTPITRFGYGVKGDSAKLLTTRLLNNIVMCARLPVAFGYSSNVPEEITVTPKPTQDGETA